MHKPVIAIIGGSQEKTYKEVGAKKGCQIIFHGGKVRNGGTRKDFRPLVKKADCVVVLLGACGHVTQEIIKALCKETNTLVTFQNGRGASGAIEKGLLAIASGTITTNAA
jgi:hypothetical protein